MVAELGTGHTPSRLHAEYWDGGVAWIGIRDAGAHHGGVIQDTAQHVSELGLANSAARLLPKDTICLSRTASVGYIVKMGRAMATSQDFVTWSCSEALNPDFLMKALLAEGEDIRRFGEGSTHTTIYFPEVKAFHIDLPPPAEQRRIVAKLDALTARIARARAELERCAILATKLRQTALESAFSGALTRDVRLPGGAARSATRPDLDDQERGLWKIDSLPFGWDWVAFEGFLEDWTDSKRKIFERDYLPQGRFPIIDQGQQFVGGYSNDASLVQRLGLPAIVFGDHTRCTKFVERPFVQGADGVKILKAACGIEPRFAYFALTAIEIPSKGYSRHMKFVRKSIWPRPPFNEQKEIVRRLESAFARADRLEAEAARAKKLLDRLEAAILAKAFRGELVAQDPADEPASVLLARIRAERASAATPKRGRRTVQAGA